MANKKYIVREYAPGTECFDSYFEDDRILGNSGDPNTTLYIDKYGSGLNAAKLHNLISDTNGICFDFQSKAAGYFQDSYKEIMEDAFIAYSPAKCHKLKQLFCDTEFNAENLEQLAEYLTIVTGKEWATESAYGYSQGDYVTMLFCKEYYKHGVENYGEVYLGAAKEFCVIYLDEDGNECDKVGGYIVADCEVNSDDDYKRLVCEWACIPEAETQLEMFDGYTQICNYRIS